MGSSSRPANIGIGMPLGSPRPGGATGGARPASELLGSPGLFQTPESEALDQWFENLQNYEVTLEEMAAASLDVNFKEELSAIEQWFKVLSEAERTAALYSLLQHSTQVQIRFFITVLQQMARSDPMTALLSPAVGGSMQNQMEAKLASLSLKSPGFASSPTARNFSMGATRTASGDNFLSPDAANLAPGDAASTLAQQRAKLKASNAAHRISAPALASSAADGRTTWGSGAPQLSQVAERPTSPGQEASVPAAARPKSTDFSGATRSPRAAGGVDGLSPIVGDSWANMVNTPLIPMFANTNKGTQKPEPAANKQPQSWGEPQVPLMEDAKKFRRVSKTNTANDNRGPSPGVPEGQRQMGAQGGDWRSGNNNNSQNTNNNNNGIGAGGPGGWNLRSPALSPGSRGYSEENGLNSAGVNMGGFNMGMGSPGLGMGIPNSAGIMPFNMNMLNMAAMGMSPEAQMLAAQMAAAGQFSPGGLSFGMAALQQQQQIAGSQRGSTRGNSVRSPGAKSSVSGRGTEKTNSEEDVDPKVLEDVPAWLRTLRLHKYTPNFEGMSWRDMVVLDEGQLEAKGVSALGARRKMLKTFEVVRKKMGIEMPAGSTTTTTSA